SVMRDENEQRNSHNQADEYLKIDFLFCGEPEVSLLRNFRVVVNEADGCKTNEGEKRKQNKGIGQISPKERGHGRRQNDQDATHRRCPCFFLMLLRTFLADILPDLQLAQAPNQPRTKNEAEKH